jgi:hypothetical protein
MPLTSSRGGDKQGRARRARRKLLIGAAEQAIDRAEMGTARAPDAGSNESEAGYDAGNL